MGRPLRVALPAAHAASRCASVAPPSAAAALRLWHRSAGARNAAARLQAFPRQFTCSAQRPTRRDSNRKRTTPPAPTPGTPLRNRAKSDAGVVEWGASQLRFRRWDDEWSDELHLSPLWLRDSCPCHSCVDPDSGQKSFSTTDLPDDPAIEHAELTTDGSLEVTFANDPLSGGASHVSVFPADEVASWRAGGKWHRTNFAVRRPERIPWDRAGYEALLAEGRCRVSYRDWMSDEPAFWDALRDLVQTGLIFVTDVPTDEKEVERVAGRIGPLQHTFYGWTWDVRSKPRAENVAYTSQFLGLHQDLMYHDPVPAVQLLHCMSNSCEGGESLFSNGVRAAYELKLRNPDAYTALHRLKAWFAYRKGGNHHFASRVTITANTAGHPLETSWAPPFQTTFLQSSDARKAIHLREWKTAATAFQRIAESEDNMVELKLKEGECVIFDNRRILHGRRQFTTGEGSRWLKGAYIAAQPYLAATTRLMEYMQSMGMTLPPAKTLLWSEDYVRESLEQREHAAEASETPQP